MLKDEAKGLKAKLLERRNEVFFKNENGLYKDTYRLK